MSVLAQLAAVIGVVIASAVTRINAVVLGQHFSVPPIVLLFAVALLALVALVLYLIRLIMQDRPVPDRRPVYVVTTAT